MLAAKAETVCCHTGVATLRTISFGLMTLRVCCWTVCAAIGSCIESVITICLADFRLLDALARARRHGEERCEHQPQQQTDHHDAGDRQPDHDHLHDRVDVDLDLLAVLVSAPQHEGVDRGGGDGRVGEQPQQPLAERAERLHDLVEALEPRSASSL